MSRRRRYSATGVYLVSEIDLPDESVNPNDKYTFQYEKSTTGNVTGRLASVTLPPAARFRTPTMGRTMESSAGTEARRAFSVQLRIPALESGHIVGPM